MEETAIERYGRKLAHVVNMYLREVKPEGWHVDKELTEKEGIKILNAECGKRGQEKNPEPLNLEPLNLSEED